MTTSCRVCGRQVEVSDSGQPMPCVCVTERRKRDEPGLIGVMAQDRRAGNPLAAVIAQCVADCVGPAAPVPERDECGYCGSEHCGGICQT